MPDHRDALINEVPSVRRSGTNHEIPSPLYIVYFSVLAAGVEKHKIDGVTVSVFNLEKTVADGFKFQNKIGLDVAIETFHECWRSRCCTMDLWKCATVCVQNVMRPYLESLTIWSLLWLTIR